jgi:hypothetical protein
VLVGVRLLGRARCAGLAITRCTCWQTAAKLEGSCVVDHSQSITADPPLRLFLLSAVKGCSEGKKLPQAANGDKANIREPTAVDWIPPRAKSGSQLPPPLFLPTLLLVLSTHITLLDTRRQTTYTTSHSTVVHPLSIVVATAPLPSVARPGGIFRFSQVSHVTSCARPQSQNHHPSKRPTSVYTIASPIAPAQVLPFVVLSKIANSGRNSSHSIPRPSSNSLSTRPRPHTTHWSATSYALVNRLHTAFHPAW